MTNVRRFAFLPYFPIDIRGTKKARAAALATASATAEATEATRVTACCMAACMHEKMTDRLLALSILMQLLRQSRDRGFRTDRCLGLHAVVVGRGRQKWSHKTLHEFSQKIHFAFLTVRVKPSDNCALH